MKTEKSLKKEKKLKFTQWEVKKKSGFLKAAAQAFEAGDFLDIVLRFWVFEAYFLIKRFLIKTRIFAVSA